MSIGDISNTAAWFAGTNPVLDAGTWGYESDTGLGKLGDGSTPWNSLGYGDGHEPVVTGSRSTATAAVLTSLLQVLNRQGVINDQTTT